MKQLLLAALVSVVCSVIAINVFAPSQPVGGPGQGGFNGGQPSFQPSMNPDDAQVQGGQRGNRQGTEQQANRGGHGGQTQAGQRGNRQGKQETANTQQNHGRGGQIAGFSYGQIEKSLELMTPKLALLPEQQDAIRVLLTQYASDAKTQREAFMHSREALMQLDMTDEQYTQNKARLLSQSSTAYQTMLVNMLSVREAIYGLLNPTQTSILSGLESQQ